MLGSCTAAELPSSSGAPAASVLLKKLLDGGHCCFPVSGTDRGERFASKVGLDAHDAERAVIRAAIPAQVNDALGVVERQLKQVLAEKVSLHSFGRRIDLPEIVV